MRNHLLLLPFLSLLSVGAIAPLVIDFAQPKPVLAETPAPAASTPQASPQASPRPISPTKRALINQLVELSGERQQYEQSLANMRTSLQQMYLPMMNQSIENLEGLSNSDKQAIRQRASAQMAEMIDRISEMMQTQVTYDVLLEEVMYPTYDQYYSEADLRGLIAFYQTPVGKKVSSVSTQMSQTMMQRMGQLFSARMMQPLTEMMQRQIDQLRQPTTPERAK
jgi:uncharacterized protein